MPRPGCARGDSPKRKAFSFFAVGVEGADMQTLAHICSPDRPPLKLKGLSFRELFTWLSSSLGGVAKSQPGQSVALPPPDRLVVGRLTLRAWRTAHASAAGTSHVRAGTPCQDHGACALIPAAAGGEILVACVADGAGSAARSAEGARMAVESFQQAFAAAAVDAPGLDAPGPGCAGRGRAGA